MTSHRDKRGGLVTLSEYKKNSGGNIDTKCGWVHRAIISNWHVGVWQYTSGYTNKRVTTVLLIQDSEREQRKTKTASSSCQGQTQHCDQYGRVIEGDGENFTHSPGATSAIRYVHTMYIPQSWNFHSLISVIASCNGECIENLPELRDQGKMSPAFSLNEAQVVIPAYRISCLGVIVQWGMYTEKRGGHLIELQVWREAESNTYRKVGGNWFNQAPTKGEKLLYFTPDPSVLISVEPGDFIGLYILHNPGINDNYKIQYESSSDVQMLYMPASSPQPDNIDPALTDSWDIALLLHVEVCKFPITAFYMNQHWLHVYKQKLCIDIPQRVHVRICSCTVHVHLCTSANDCEVAWVRVWPLGTSISFAAPHQSTSSSVPIRVTSSPPPTDKPNSRIQQDQQLINAAIGSTAGFVLVMIVAVVVVAVLLLLYLRKRKRSLQITTNDSRASGLPKPNYTGG